MNEEEQNNDNERFSVDIQSLILEAQSVSPEEKKEFDQLVEEAHLVFLEKFGEYIDEPMSQEEMKQKFLLMDEKTYKEFNYLWKADPKAKRKDIDHGFFKTYDEKGQFVVGIYQDVWDKFNEKDKKDLIESHGDEEKAKKYAQKIFYQNVILHEMTHLYQKPEQEEKQEITPLWLAEAQAYWVGKNLAEVDIDIDDDQANVYQQLIYLYGKDLHKLCLASPETADKVLAEKVKGTYEKYFREE